MSFPPPFYRWRPHPWHGLDAGPNVPDVVQAYIEITPFDRVKYEVDKVTGYTRVDRPQRSSSSPPTLYGFVPRTYCGPRVGALCPGATGGDRDPLDICVVSEHPISRADLILDARVVGGLQMVDGGEADDKIVAVLDNDLVWGRVEKPTLKTNTLADKGATACMLRVVRRMSFPKPRAGTCKVEMPLAFTPADFVLERIPDPANPAQKGPPLDCPSLCAEVPRCEGSDLNDGAPKTCPLLCEAASTSTDPTLRSPFVTLTQCADQACGPERRRCLNQSGESAPAP